MGYISSFSGRLPGGLFRLLLPDSLNKKIPSRIPIMKTVILSLTGLPVVMILIDIPMLFQKPDLK